MREPQCRRQLSTVRDKIGTLHVAPEAIASCLKDFWDGVSTPSHAGV